MRRRIVLHGYLADLYPSTIEVEAETIAEALRALSQISELHREDGSPHSVRVTGVDSNIALFSNSTLEEIHVHPIIGGGGGRGGLLQVLLGIVLVAVAIFVPVIGIGAMTFSTSGLFLTGALMALGGVLQMLLPAPETTTDSTQAGKYLGANGNTVRIGTRISLGYGTRRVGGHYLSYDVDAVEVAPGHDETVATEDSRYVTHDVTVLSRPLAPVNPVYASSVTSPTGVPISQWSATA